MNKLTRELNLELFERLLVAERSRIDEEISKVQAAAHVPHRGRPPGRPKAVEEPTSAPKPKGRSAAAKRKQSLRMKKYWAERRAEKAKAEKTKARKPRKKAAKAEKSPKRAVALKEAA